MSVLGDIAAMLIRARARDVAGYAHVTGACSRDDVDALEEAFRAVLHRDGLEPFASADDRVAMVWVGLNETFMRRYRVFQDAMEHRSVERELTRPWGQS